MLLGLAALSLALALTMAVFWVRSYQYYDAVFYSNLERTHQLFTTPGAVVLSTWNHLAADDFVYDGASGPRVTTPMTVYRDGQVKTINDWDYPASMHLGFWLDRGSITKTQSDGVSFEQTHLNLAVPLWLVMLAFLIAPGTWCWKLWQRYNRSKTGRCIYCNTVMPTPDRCPGCEHEFEHWVM